MQKRILEFVNRHGLFTPGDRVLAAVSGGADSVCLLTLLCRLQGTLGLSAIHAVHMHHGLRGPEADRDAAFTEELCRKLEVPCTVVYRDVTRYAEINGFSAEEAGRILRYETFDEIVQEQGLTKIAVAHHQDDEAETILHHLVRGSGLKGLSGIPLSRGLIVRPLLCVDRAEIEAFLAAEGIPYCCDSTNADSSYTRNKIRNRLIPIARELNGQAVANICQAGAFIGQADAYFENVAAKRFTTRGHCDERAAVLYPADSLLAEPEIVRSYVIRHLLGRCTDSLKDITAQHIFQIQALAAMPTGSHLDLPGRLAAEREYGFLKIFRMSTDENEDISLPALHFRRFSAYNAGEIPKKQYTKWLDYDKIKGMLSVRTRQSGDYLTIGSGGSKRLKAYLIDEKIPRHLRSRLPLLTEENHVVWIIGYRISEYYKITEETKTILEVTVDGGENYGR